MATIKVRYLESRKLKDGSTGWVWNNRHARKFGMEAEWLGTDEVAAHQRAKQLNTIWDEVRRGRTLPKPERIEIRALMAADTIGVD